MTNVAKKYGPERHLTRAKPWLRPLVRSTLGNLPRPIARFTGALAKEGGIPVRNTRYRPWPLANDGNLLSWQSEVRARLRGVYLSGVEGLPIPNRLLRSSLSNGLRIAVVDTAFYCHTALTPCVSHSPL